MGGLLWPSKKWNTKMNGTKETARVKAGTKTESGNPRRCILTRAVMGVTTKIEEWRMFEVGLIRKERRKAKTTREIESPSLLVNSPELQCLRHARLHHRRYHPRRTLFGYIVRLDKAVAALTPALHSTIPPFPGLSLMRPLLTGMLRWIKHICWKVQKQSPLQNGRQRCVQLRWKRIKMLVRSVHCLYSSHPRPLSYHFFAPGRS
jgi:hypothetical protein